MGATDSRPRGVVMPASNSEARKRHEPDRRLEQVGWYIEGAPFPLSSNRPPEGVEAVPVYRWVER